MSIQLKTEGCGPNCRRYDNAASNCAPPKLDENDYCMLSNVEKESAKCVFPMVLCMPGRKNCKIVEDWSCVFNAVVDYISAHQDALVKIEEYVDRIERYRDRMREVRGKSYGGKDPRVKKWLLGITRGRKVH